MFIWGYKYVNQGTCMHFHIAEYLSLPYLSKKLITHKATKTWSSRSAVYQICQIWSILSTGIQVWVLVFTLCCCSSHPEDVLKNYHNSSTLLQPHCVHPPQVLLNLQHWKGTVSSSCCCQVHICTCYSLPIILSFLQYVSYHVHIKCLWPDFRNSRQRGRLQSKGPDT